MGIMVLRKVMELKRPALSGVDGLALLPVLALTADVSLGLYISNTTTPGAAITGAPGLSEYRLICRVYLAEQLCFVNLYAP